MNSQSSEITTSPSLSLDISESFTNQEAQQIDTLEIQNQIYNLKHKAQQFVSLACSKYRQLIRDNRDNDNIIDSLVTETYQAAVKTRDAWKELVVFYQSHIEGTDSSGFIRESAEKRLKLWTEALKQFETAEEVRLPSREVAEKFPFATILFEAIDDSVCQQQKKITILKTHLIFVLKKVLQTKRINSIW